MKTILLAFAICLAGCGKEPVSPRPQHGWRILYDQTHAHGEVWWSKEKPVVAGGFVQFSDTNGRFWMVSGPVIVSEY